MNIRLKSITSLILFVGVFLLSLVNFPIYVWAIGLSLVILFLMIEKVSPRKEPVFESLFLILLVAIAAIRFQVFLVSEVSSLYVNAFLGNTVRFVLCIGTWYSIRTIALSDKNKFLKGLLAPLLKLHVVFFYVQFFTYFISGYYIDPVNAFGGDSSRYSVSGGDFIEWVTFRATGMFVEPSTYFYVVLALAIILFIKVGFKKHKRLFLFTIISMYLTFSTAAIVIASLFILYYLYNQKIRFRSYFLLVISIISIFFLSSDKISELYQSQKTRIEGGSGELRMNLIKTVLNRDLDNAITGYGAYAVEEELSQLTRAESEERIMSSINDAGLFVYMWASLGFLGITYFFVLCLWQYKISKQSFWLFLILSLTKIQLFGPLFVFYFAYSVVKKENHNKELSPILS